MNEELSDFLRDLFLGMTLDDEEVQGVDFLSYNDGAMQVRIRSRKPFVREDSWHFLFIPAANIQVAQDRLTSIPSVLALPSTKE